MPVWSKTYTIAGINKAGLHKIVRRHSLQAARKVLDGWQQGTIACDGTVFWVKTAPQSPLKF